MAFADPTEQLPVSWRERETPLEAVAVVGTGPAARALAKRLLQDDDALLVKRRGAGGTADCLLLIFAETPDELPWADGVTYIGRDPAAPSLLVPTTLTPNAPLPLVERSLRGRFPLLDPPIVFLPQLGRIFSATVPRPISRRVLSTWLAAWDAAGRNG